MTARYLGAGSLALLLLTTHNVHAQLMDSALQARLEKALPTLASSAADNALHGRTPGKRLFYTGNEIEHASQDHSGAGVGFYLSSHNRSANRDGQPGTDFEFPWKNPGGTDGINGTAESNVYAWKVMFLPGDSKVRVHHRALRSFFGGSSGSTFFGRNGEFTGWGWTFPEGTRFYELLSFKDRLTVFEVRVRHKSEGKWRVNVYRPFSTREDFAAAVDGFHGRVKAFSLSSALNHRNRVAFQARVAMEEVPGLATTKEADELIRGRVFESCLNKPWAGETVVAPWSKSATSIVPKDYNGAFVGNTTASCQKCHQDSATHVRFFDANREWYGFVRGEREEKILSFHPADPTAISRQGGHTNFRLNQKLVDASIIEWRP